MPLAIFGIENTALNLVVTILVLVLVAVWLALIAFTFTDARRRISDPFLVGCATAASFFPFVGTIVYSILRPPEFLEDVRERETEVHTSEVRLRHLEHNSCHKCGTPVESDFLRCPSCRSRLKQPCGTCERPVGLDWKVCPYCETTLIAPKRSSRSGSRGSGQGGSKPSARPKSGSRSSSGRSAKAAEADSRSVKDARQSGGSRSASGTKTGSQPAAKSDGASRSPRAADDAKPARTPRAARRKAPVDPDEPTKAEPINRGSDA